jgi:hypothetical protein
MSVTTPPPPKKRGLGCLGCGCLVLAILAVLVLGLLTALGYFIYSEMVALSSTVPLAVPSFDGGDEMYNSAKQKVVAFDQDLHDHQAATLQLSGDEINTLIARNPGFTQNKILLYVTLADNEASMQASVPTKLIPYVTFPKPYLNSTASFGLDFNSDDKTLNLAMHKLQIGEKAMPPNMPPILQSEINLGLNMLLQDDPEGKLLLEQTKSIEIQNNELVIETE